MKLSNKAYDYGKFVAQILLPAIATLYYALSELWHLPHAGEIVGTITAVDAFLGALLSLSSKKYNTEYDGDIEVDGSTYTLALKDDPESIPSKRTMSFRVVNK
jgi:hypothetical protein